MWTMTFTIWGGVAAVMLAGVSLILLAKSWRMTRRARRLVWRTCRFTVHHTDERYASLLIQPTDSLTPLELGVRRTGPFAPNVRLHEGVGFVAMGAGSRALVSTGGYLPIRAWILAEEESDESQPAHFA